MWHAGLSYNDKQHLSHACYIRKQDNKRSFVGLHFLLKNRTFKVDVLHLNEIFNFFKAKFFYLIDDVLVLAVVMMTTKMTMNISWGTMESKGIGDWIGKSYVSMKLLLLFHKIHNPVIWHCHTTQENVEQPEILKLP